MPLSIFGFQALWSPYLIGVIIFLTVLYFLVTVTWRKDFKVSEPLKKSEAIYFLLAMITLYIVIGSPIDLLSHILFTMHMVQMALLLLLVPVFLIKGIPWWIWRIVVNAPVVKTIFKIFTKPVVAVFVFAMMFSLYHLPVIFDAIKLDETFHGIFTFIVFLSAFFMNWPLLNTLEDQPKMKSLYKLGYIIANAVLITPACALIIFAGEPLYATYSDGDVWLKAMELCVPAGTLAGLGLSGPELFFPGNLTTLGDQQTGGVLMKIIQEIIFAVILFKVFRQWWNEEHSTNEDEITEKALKEFQALKQSQQH
ncbi:cytochrome C oxidase assembly protein [Ureibacillus massiliensis 4400831 = CIP 108448 = CCUG 49529]|uniref:Cytochrome C oxidase assembly protein n=1 Tax=Ureibacillus massiliensis 4400831 = CIP 108448 = CCUG 49529 TaxID=1211035 RepID=A0A0A3J565_9BACL|nr:cytochrome c oxidase assembly factor CtaG [Ureibacillus massiliensis]KGR92189.1 cytochrome C oxidase assembly protein [Ureibacillus massiliensis 4400831 = CIP 108448 = CCUG 49529]